jgi:hypothetical protein
LDGQYAQLDSVPDRLGLDPLRKETRDKIVDVSLWVSSVGRTSKAQDGLKAGASAMSVEQLAYASKRETALLQTPDQFQPLEMVVSVHRLPTHASGWM